MMGRRAAPPLPVESTSAVDAAGLAINLIRKAKAGFGAELVECAAKLRSAYFQPELAGFYGQKAAAIERLLAEMEDIGRELNPPIETAKAAE